ncbi:hypothetical protein AX15_005833 [Amanita polypyramis BW_CC]|nr:hypothetical protein AX15_005833 [Amanita polypyramis BW_CC]
MYVRSYFLKWLPPTYRSEVPLYESPIPFFSVLNSTPSQMSSKRGRKRNDNLPPNRARDVQRAFRARRAAHLQALEQRVSELEEENGILRQALSLPPSTRPPLGKGPTGKDKPKQTDDMILSCGLGMHSGRGSSNDDSPSSRTSSLSPCTLTVPMPVRPAPVIEGGSWDDAILLSDQHSDISGPSTSSYQMTMSAPTPLKPLHHYSSYSSSSLPSNSRNNTASLYVATTSQYPPSPDRISNSIYNSHGYLVRGESSRQFSTYPHPTFQTTDTEIHPHTPPPSIPIQHPDNRESPMPYPPRRSFTEPQGYIISQGYPHLPHSSLLQQNARGPECPRMQDGNGHLPLHPNPHPQTHPQQSTRSMFGPDGRINSTS